MTTAPFTSSRPMTWATGSDAPTAKQAGFIRSLMARKDTTVLTVDDLVSATIVAKEEPSTVTKARASQLIDALLKLPDMVKTRPETENWTDTTAGALEAGRYATEFDGKLRFFVVDKPTTGRWAGYMFVREQAGGDLFSIGTARRRKVMEALVADSEALARYGKELGVCGRCGRELTDETSRQAGLGPVCRTK